MVLGGAVVSVLLAPGHARADADEVSAHGHVLGGIARTTESGTTANGTMLGLGGRFTLARSDVWALEVQGTALSARTRYDDITVTIAGAPQQGTMDRSAVAGRAELGAHLRFGVRWIPTAHAAAGVQVRRLGATSLRRMDGTALASIEGATATDLTLAAAVGLDRRVGRSLVVGALVGAVHAFPVGGDAGGFDGLELTVHAAWYFYPRWLPLAGWRGSAGGNE